MSKGYNQKTMCTLGCCHSMLASFLCLLNLVSLAVGGILIGTGIYGFIKMENYFLIMGDEYLFTSSILTGIGATILIIGFFGCCGTCTETSWMIKIYSILLIIALILEIGTLTASLILNEEIVKSLSSNLMNELVKYNVSSNGMKYYDDSNPLTIDLHHVDFLQIHLKCCGVLSYIDWENNSKFNETRSVPDSCCKSPSVNCGLNMISNGIQEIEIEDRETSDDINDDIYRIGCEHESKTVLKKNILIVSLVTVLIFGLQIFAIILSWCLSEQMKNKKWWSYRYSKQPFAKRNRY